MTNFKNSIKDAIERQAGNGDWNGITVDDGRYEGNVDTLNIDADTIEFEDVDLDVGTIAITAGGLCSATHKDANGEEVTDEYDVTVRAKMNISIESASIQSVLNKD